MDNATKRIFIALNIKVELVKAAVTIISLIQTDSAKRNSSVVPTLMEFALLALLHSLSHQEAVLLPDALNTLPKAALTVILVLSWLTESAQFLTANKSLDSLAPFALMATNSTNQTNVLLSTPTVRSEMP
jgi:hypothetical protein